MVHVHGRRRVGATMPPEGKDNLKGQACLGCKRNGMRTQVHVAAPVYQRAPGHLEAIARARKGQGSGATASDAVVSFC
jgi:hypothetical protein